MRKYSCHDLVFPKTVLLEEGFNILFNTLFYSAWEKQNIASLQSSLYSPDNKMETSTLCMPDMVWVHHILPPVMVDAVCAASNSG
jgi:hypothetical protein